MFNRACGRDYVNLFDPMDKIRNFRDMLFKLNDI